MYRNYGKRLFDFVVSASALLLLAPLMAVLAVLVRFKLGSPVLFCQERPGKDGKPFVLKKFRSMTDARDVNGEPLSDAERLTPFGKLLRATSLDELPELWNVLKGDMSLVGPRPLLMRYLPYYSERESQRHAVRPGLTGWAQINGRNEVGWNERLEMDVWYVENLSLWLDLKILGLTVVKVLTREKVHVDSRSIILDFDVERKQLAGFDELWCADLSHADLTHAELSRD